MVLLGKNGNRVKASLRAQFYLACRTGVTSVLVFFRRAGECARRARSASFVRREGREHLPRSLEKREEKKRLFCRLSFVMKISLIHTQKG